MEGEPGVKKRERGGTNEERKKRAFFAFFLCSFVPLSLYYKLIQPFGHRKDSRSSFPSTILSSHSSLHSFVHFALFFHYRSNGKRNRWNDERTTKNPGMREWGAWILIELNTHFTLTVPFVLIQLMIHDSLHSLENIILWVVVLCSSFIFNSTTIPFVLFVHLSLFTFITMECRELNWRKKNNNNKVYEMRV